MKINFTKQQYDTLLEMVQLGYFITFSNEATANDSKYVEMEQYLLSFAEDFNHEGVLYDSQDKMYSISVEHEQEIQQIIDEYEDMVFWDKLVYYLARRDFTKEMTEQPVEDEAALQHLIEMEDKYHKHFEKHGVKYLMIDK